VVVFGFNGRASFQKRDPRAPFLMGQVHLARKIMQMLNQRPHDLAHPGVHFI
jgi:hypothetical protein